MKLTFNVTEVKNLLTALPADAEVTIVGDQGIYIMSFAQEPNNRTIVYAKGCNPDKDENWYDKKEAVWGGDDGGEKLGEAGDLLELFAQEEGREVKDFFVKVNRSSIQAGVTTALNKEAKDAKHEAWVKETLAKLKALTDEKLSGTRNWFYQKRNLAKTAKERKLYISLIEMAEDEIRTRPNLKGWIHATDLADIAKAEGGR